MTSKYVKLFNLPDSQKNANKEKGYFFGPPS